MEEQELSLRDYFEIMRRRKKLILSVFAIAVAGSAVISFVLPPVYQVKSTVKVGQIVDLNTFEKDPIETAIAAAQFLEGSGVLTEAINDMGLPFTIRELRKRVSVHPVVETKDLVEIRVETTNPRQALDMANYLANKLLKRHHEIKSLHEDEKVLLARYNQQIVSIEKELADIIDESRKEILTRHDEQIRGINQQFAQIETQKREIGTEYDGRIKRIDGQLAQIEDEVVKTKEEMKKLQETGQVLSSTLQSRMEGSKPLSDAESRLLVGQMQDVTTRLADYRTDIRNKENRYDALMSESREAEIKKIELLRSVQTESDALMKEFREVQTKKIELMRTTQQQYDSLMAELRKIEIDKTKLQRIDSITMYPTEIVVLPQEPEEPIRPRKLLNIVVAAVISLVVALALAFSLESFAGTKQDGN